MSLKPGDLKGTIIPEISIDEFEPKTGKESEVIVVAFYFKDRPPAEDLNTFIQRGFIETLDVEVSPNTDQDGRYLVFIELPRDSNFKSRFFELIKDVENLTGKVDWIIKTYLSSDDTFSIDDPELFKFVITDPDNYSTKDKFMKNNLEESVKNFFENTLAGKLTFNNGRITLESNNKRFTAVVEDAGPHDKVMGRNFLTESAFRLSDLPYEAKLLESALGTVSVLPVGRFLCLHNNGMTVLLSETCIDYGI